MRGLTRGLLLYYGRVYDFVGVSKSSALQIIHKASRALVRLYKQFIALPEKPQDITY